MKNLRRSLGTACLLLAAVTVTQAQPANNNFANAFVLTGAVVSTNGNSGQQNQGIPNANKEPGEPNHAGYVGGRSVWFRWTAPATAQVRVDTIGTPFNSLLAVYTGDAVNALTEVASNDDGPGIGTASLLEFNAIQGTTYHIAIDGEVRFGGQFRFPQSGPYTLNLRTLASVAITSPAAGTVFAAGEPILVTAGGEVPNPPIVRMDFYRGPDLFATDTEAPFSAVANNSPPGSNSLYVVALDNAGLSWTSAVVRVAVLSEGVTIVVPEDGSIYVNPTSIPVMVLERLPSGAITNVEFFVDGVKFGESSMAPFTASWTNVTGGSHRFIAVGRDDSGRSYQSAPINVGVSQLIVPRGSVWKYLDDGSDQGTAWTAPDFDDNAWASGPGELGYGDGDEATVVSSGPDPNNRYVTTYFRHAFEVANPTAFQFLLVNLKRDDGAVLYVNGIEAARFNMPAGPITATTLAQNAQDDGATFFPAVLPASLLVEGRNVLAVEIHQTSLNSSDISFEMDLIGIPVVIRNLSPTVALTSPADNAVFLAPPSINLEATASDEDGSVAKVEFYAGATKVGEDGESPYTATWLNPPMGPTVLTAVAIDNQGAAQSSTGITVHVFDAVGTPFARVTSPLEGAVMEGPTNLLVSAFASAVDSVSRVEFRANGELFGEDDSAPYSAVWTAPFGTSALTAVAVGADGKRGTSAPVNVTITIPPTNTVAPTLVAQTPAPGAVVTNLTSISVTFSERVFHVDAADLLVNGVPATNVVGSGSNYTFSVAQPAFGTVTITWATGHGIEDFGYPANLPFDENGPGASWSFELVDRAPPVVVGRVPAAGATVTNLTEISVTFSEPVTGVDAADFLVNGVPAFGLSGGGASYTFNFQQPPAGTVNISWNPAHGIADLAVSPNPFNATGPGATWTLTLDTRTILVQSNANWRFIKGTAEASSPINAWRQPAFDDSGWSNALAPFYYGDPYNSAANPGTLLSDMQGNYSSIYLRRHFTVADVSVITNLYLAHQSDDGFIAWINGVEVLRYNMDAGEIPYNGSAPATAQEVGQAGAPYIAVALPNPAAYLVEGENLLAVHAFNNQPQTSSDFGFNAQLYTYIPDPKHNPPRVARLTPPAGEVLGLTEITVRFTEPVTGVDATDLLINGAPATGLSSTNAATYTFTFPQPPFGPATLTWIADPGIVDFDDPPKAFDGAAATFQYSVVNPAAPTVALQNPAAGASLTNLNQIAITFSEPVTGVDAEDLLINGAPALNVTGGGASYVFTLAEPPYGTVSVGWAADHGIRDLESPPNAFDGLRRGNFWSYALVDRTPPTLVQINPAPGAQVLNLRELTVRFSEPVIGVNASDLRINGASAITVTGTNDLYTFTFAQPNATLIHITWVNNHGITDRAPTPNAFDAAAPGATWSYTTPDTVAPTVGAAEPAPFITIRSLNQIRITFTEPVTGVDAADLLVNNQPAFALSGSGAGPYTFSYLPPTNGTVEVRWQPGHGIADLASPTPNPFPGGEWTYTLDPNATFAGRIVINEIMFNPESGRAADEWLELRNTSTQLINLTGWRLTRGVDFTFPNVSIRAGGYLVVAADTEAFRVLYPNVTNVVGGWSGQLANSDEEIQLETASGEIVSTVHYATEGDWARRERGHGAQRITRITREGTTATVTVFGHGYTANDRIHISGADQPEFNGLFAINVSPTSPSTFTITVPESTNQPPVTNATGLLIARHAVDDGASGWSWFSLADGFGRSLEQINPTRGLPVGQNWLASTNAGGTPGRANSVNSANIAPLILDVAHFPPVPRSTDPVTITARVLDESPTGVTNVTLYYRNHTTAAPGPFATTNLLDDGAHGDGLNRDGLYGATLPPAAHGTIIEFYVQATDNGGRTRTWPAPTWETNDTFLQLANALYQVDDEAPSPATAAMPTYRVIMTGTERATFPPAVRQSDAEANVTFISTDGEGTKVRYLGGLRVRGAGSRSQTPPNNRLNIPNDNRWNGYQAINLNGLYVHNQLIGAAVAERAALPAARARLIQYRINGVNPAPLTPPGGGGGAGYGAFVMVEPVNGDLAERLFPEDPAGNVYRASSGGGQGGGIHLAQLNHLGTNADSYLTAGYFKASNGTENDWTDLFNLTFAFSQNTLPLPDYVQMMETNVNVQLWMRYFALGTLINFGETSMFNGRGDDYALYRGLQDPRFVAIGHDFDTIFGQGDTTGTYPTSTNSSIFIMLSPPATGANAPNMPVLRRFLTNEHFAPLFFAEIKRLADTVFHPDQLGPLMDQYLNWPNGPTTATIQNMKTFAANRRRVVLSQIPLTLTVSNSLTSSNGFLLSPSGTATLFGTFHAIDSRRVLVNGSPSILSPWEGRWTNTVTLQPGLNRVLVQSLNSNEIEIARSTVDIWYDDGSLQTVSGALTSDTVWSAANGPYQVTGNVTINPGVTLTILPGTTVYLGPGVNVVVANGGTLIAEGTDTARIRFAAAPGSGATWGGLTINGGPNSPESRLAYVHFDNNGDVAVEVADGTVFLDHLTFGNTSRQYLSLDRASFVVQHCVFPATTGSFEPTHGSGGIKAGGRGIFRRNFFGKVQGYNDALDFTGGNRPGPILQVLNNVFMGSDDDLLDLDSTDAWIEGNIFLHVHRNGSPDSASAVSGGSDNADNSQITIVGNLFYDIDHAVNAKQTNFYTLINNTIVRQTKVGSQDTNTAVIILADQNEQGTFTSQGAGVYLEGNIIHGAENLTRHLTTAVVTFTNNIIHQLAGTPWSGPGGGNVMADPLLKRIPLLSETTNYTSWEQAQVLWDHFSLLPGSPAAGTGPNGRDKGGVIPLGVSLSGEPEGATPFDTATLRVGPLRAGFSIPAAGFPGGSGYTHYRWRLDGGVWSAETPTGMPISLDGLSPGEHVVEVVGRRDSGFYQDDPVFGEDAVVTVSRTWVVDPSSSPLRLNEVLARNAGAVNHHGTTPDAIELYNASDFALNLAGFRLTDDPAQPGKFVFPPGASVAPRAFLVVWANDPDGTPGYHLGFALNQDGDALYLYAPVAQGGRLLDEIRFGPQLPDLSVGRLAGGQWGLTEPTFGAANRAAPVGDAGRLKLNEWLATATTPFDSDFVEIYNPESRPVALGGLYLTDNLLGWPDRHAIAPLSFIAAGGYLTFLADGRPQDGALHLGFALNGDQGAIGLLGSDLQVIDSVVYPPQRPNVSQGRSPNGGATIVWLTTPTPGAANPVTGGPLPFGGGLVINEVFASNASLVETLPPGTNLLTPDWLELYNGTTNAIDLGDLSLTDDSSQPRRFVFPAGTVVAPGGWWRVLCVGGEPVSARNAGFGLRKAGGSVWLFDQPGRGGGVISRLDYGVQTADFSVGRVPDGSTNWVLTTPTPESANQAVPALGAASGLVINEWMANPEGEEDWFEVFNPGPLPVALGGLFLSDDLNDRSGHRVADLSFIGSGTNGFVRFWADGVTGAGADHVGFSLRAGGEHLALWTAAGGLVDGVRFGAQSNGVSQGRFPDGATNIVFFPGTASPGESNWRPLTNVVVNEVLSHSGLPLEDAIELRNVSALPIDVGGWWLSDDRGTLRKYQIPGPRVIPPQGFMVIYEDVLTNAETALVPFALGARGDEVVLSVASNNVLTGFRTVVEFGPAARGVSFGRHVTSDGRVEFVALEARTFGADDPGSVEEFRTGRGASNAPPRVGPVVISEIMYHPPDLGALDNARDEFIELRNVTTAPVALFEQGHGWRLRDGVDFDFRAGTVLPPGGELLVVGFDPANDPEALAGFRARYNLPASTVVVGPWSGRLANDSDEIELRRPEVTEGAEEPAYILVERVRYADASPWPPQADGTGYSIQRRAEKAFANDPTNWVADVPNPGPASAQTDSDGDGLPNAWEIEHGLDPFNPADVGLDPDGDGLSNGQEYQTGTDPRDPTSGLWLSVTRGVAEELVLSFSAAANLGYVVEAAESLAGPWRLLRSFAAESTNRVVSFGVPANGARRFFRLRLAGAQAPGTVDYVVHISLDGLGATYLERYVAEAPGAFPTFARLMREGAYTFNARCDYDISETIPNHATMLTGRPVMQPVGYPDTTHHGYNNNFPGAADTFHTHGNPAVPYKASLFDVAHDHGLATAFYASKTRLAICDRSYDDFNGGLDLIGLDDGRDKIDFASVADLSGAAISNEVNRVLADLSGPGPRNYSFIHLAEPDLTGHAVGWGTPGWSNAVRLVDAELGRILDAITGNPILADRTAVIVTADHGGGGVNPRGHTEAYHVTNYTIPFFVWGPGIPGGQNLYLLLNNRADPGTNRVEPHVLPQPLRAGDSGNLGLSLLGLPPIPGSFHVPEFAPGNGPLRVNSITALGGGQVQLEISVPANKGCTILSAPTPTGPTWTAVASYPAVSSNRVMRVTVAQNGANGFYRLRTP